MTNEGKWKINGAKKGKQNVDITRMQGMAHVMPFSRLAITKQKKEHEFKGHDWKAVRILTPVISLHSESRF